MKPREADLRSPGILLVNLIILGGFCGCQPQPELLAPQPDPSASTAQVTTRQLTIVDPVRELGKLSSESQRVEFSLTNTGTEVLKIDHLEATCDCVSTTLSRDSLPAGEQAILTLDIQPKEPEQRSAKVRIHSDATDSPHEVIVRWLTKGPVEITPGTLDFGPIAPGTTAVRELTVQRSEAGRDCELALVPTPKDSMQVTRKESAETDAETEVWEVRVTAAELPGGYHGSIRASFGVCNLYPYRIPVSWQSQHPIDIRPTALFLGTRKSGDAVTGELQIRVAPGQTIQIRELSWKGQTLKVEPVYVAEEPHAGRITFQGLAGSPGIQRDHLQIHFASPEKLRVEIPVSMVVRE